MTDLTAYKTVEGTLWQCRGCSKTAVVSSPADKALEHHGEGVGFTAKTAAMNDNIRCCSKPNWATVAVYDSVTLDDLTAWPEVDAPAEDDTPAE